MTVTTGSGVALTTRDASLGPMLDPFAHAAHATGRAQTALVDCWANSGIAISLSDVTGPHLYEFGSLPVPTVAITLYRVKRHVLMVNGRVRRDGQVLPGRFRIGQPGQDIIVDADPGSAKTDQQRKLLIVYLGADAMAQIADDESGARIELRDPSWDTEDPFLHMLAHRLVQPGRNRNDRILADQIGLTMGLHLLDRYAMPVVRKPRLHRLSQPTLHRVVEFIHARPGLQCSLAELAAVAGYSPSHFLRQFQRATGMTPHKFIQGERIARAKDLLTHTAQSGAEIALACGFSSQSHFGTAFRSVTGLTPRAWRALAGPK